MLFSFFFWLEPVAFASALSSQAPQRDGSAFGFAGAPPFVFKGGFVAYRLWGLCSSGLPSVRQPTVIPNAAKRSEESLMRLSFFLWLEPVAFASALSSRAPQHE